MRRYKICLSVVLASLFVLYTSEAFAGTKIEASNLRHLTRGMIWTSFRNGGTQGYTDGDGLGRAALGFVYPGYATGVEDFDTYWKLKPFSGDDAKAEDRKASAGEGVWVMAKPGGGPKVSYTGPRIPTTDVIPMFYDIVKASEANLGLPTVTPKRARAPGKLTANWYKGASPFKGVPDEQQPYEIHNYDYGRYIENDQEAEETILSRWTTGSGITVTRKAKAWSYQDFDDFFVVEFEFENTGDTDGDGVANAVQDLNDTYFGFMSAFYVNTEGTNWRLGHRFAYVEYNETSGLDDWIKYTDAPNYGSFPDDAASLKGLKLVYQYDGDSPNTSGEDTGDPFIRDLWAAKFPNGARPDGTPISPEYVGVAPIAYKNAPDHTATMEGAPVSLHGYNKRDAAVGYKEPKSSNPVTWRWWRVYRKNDYQAPLLETRSESQIYDEMTGKKATILDPYTGKLEDTSNLPRSIDMGWNALIFGPYDLKPGEKTKIVLAYLGGSGAEYDITPETGYAKDIMSWTHSFGTLPDDQRIARLRKGRDAVVRHYIHAQALYNVDYDVPDAPPDVDWTIVNNDKAQNRLVWSDNAKNAVNPDYTGAEAKDVAGYRVYRSTWQEYGPWKLIVTIPAQSSAHYNASTGTYSYDDTESAAGINYFYSVRTFSKGHSSWSNGAQTLADMPKTVQDHVRGGQESGYSAPEQRMLGPESPFQLGLDKTDRLEEKVRVVPNPFILGDDERSYQGTFTIRFVGIPRKCKIHIYSISGDRVGLIEHDKSSGEATWLQYNRLVTDRVGSGLYFYVVESLVPGSEGKLAKGTFMIIR